MYFFSAVRHVPPARSATELQVTPWGAADKTVALAGVQSARPPLPGRSRHGPSFRTINLGRPPRTKQGRTCRGTESQKLLAGGGGFAAVTPDTPFTTGLYWAVVTAATVGYGDVSPKNPAGRVVAVVVMLTAIPLLAAVFALVTGAAAVAGLRRILEMEHPFPAGSYRLVLGSHPAVPGVLDDLAEAGQDVVLVADVDQAKVPRHVHVVRGDPTRAEVVEAANPEGAQQALITGGTDSDVLVSAVLVRKRAPGLPLTALVNSPSVREALRELGVQQVISADALLAHTLAKSLETPHAG